MTPKIRILFLSLIILLISNFYLFSQVSLTISTNTLRHGDILCKIEVPYVEQGERGSESIWNLPEIPDDGKEYLQVTSACSSDPTIDDNAGNTEERPNVLIKNNGDAIVVEGVNVEERIDFFNMDGTLLGTAPIYPEQSRCSCGFGRATTTSDALTSFVSTEDVIIVKIGNQSIKVA